MTRPILKNIKPHLAPLLLLLGMVAITYAPSLSHEFIGSWDDYLYVIDNEAVRGVSADHLKRAFTSFFVGNYAPLQILSYMLDYSLWGLRAGGFLFTNTLLHAFGSVLF